jgi:hypothetical protein
VIPPERRTATYCDVHVRVPGLDRAGGDGLGRDLVEGMTIVDVVERTRSVTGRARRVVAPPGEYRTVAAGGRGQIHALHEGPLGEWIAHLDGDPEHAWMGRSLMDVLTELLDLPFGRREEWVYEAIEALAGHRTSLGVRYACPCCDLLTLTEPPPGTFEICPVCRWEDDGIQFVDPDYAGGANRPSLLQARETYRRERA